MAAFINHKINDMNSQFEAPPEGALQTNADRALAVKYKANKTPESYAHLAVPDKFPTFVENLALGFQYYDKETSKRIALPNFTFIVLEIYAGISGYNDETKTQYWSNRVLDTRTDELIVSSSSGPVARGIYQAIKESLPAGASYTKFVKAYCLTLDRVVEIELTASAERGMQKAIAAAEMAAGRKAKWENVFLLNLARNDHFWGFNLTGYARETKQGAEYAGKGELYLSPVFMSGIVNPTKSPDLHAKCVELQAAERQAHEAYKARNTQAATSTTPGAGTQPPSSAEEVPLPQVEPAQDYDDLPF